MDTHTHTDTDTDEGLFLMAEMVLPIMLYIFITPMPYGWGTMEFEINEAMKHMDTYLFITMTAVLVFVLAKMSKSYRETFGKGILDGLSESEPAGTQAHTHTASGNVNSVSSARIERSGKQITVYDEKNRVIYKKL